MLNGLILLGIAPSPLGVLIRDGETRVANLTSSHNFTVQLASLNSWIRAEITEASREAAAAVAVPPGSLAVLALGAHR